MTVKAVAKPRWQPSPLLIRILSGGAILFAFLALLLAGEWGIRVLVVVVGGLALWEFRGLSHKIGFRAPSWLIFPLGAYFAFSGTLLKRVDIELVLSLALVVGLAAFLILPERRGGLGRWAMGLGGAIYIGLPFNYYLLLYASAPRDGMAWILFTILAVVVSDTAALLVGRAVGHTPFFQGISPHKTVEGAVAGILLCAPVMLLGSVTGLEIGPLHAVVIGLLIGLSAEVGDLVESQMKRVAGVKDSSNLIPGHGGVLDRIDSLLFPPILV
ncbi:MAG TPA: phosphatidate cytidylyltransferase, partial [Candidatus Dormibacteraeota bacterium]